MKRIVTYLNKLFPAVVLSLVAATSTSQPLTLKNAILIAQENSYDAQLAKYSYLASYWAYRSFKAQLMPSVNLRGGLMNFNHSSVEARNYEDGKVAYVDNNTLDNNMTLSLDQKIAATGGTISLQSYLYRLDQFTYNERTYNSQPMRVSYTQPLMAFNSLKWEKKTAPLEFEIAQRKYISSMQDIAVKTTQLYFDVLAAQSACRQSEASLADREALYEMAKKRLQLGTTTKSEVLQLELSLINTRVAVRNDQLALNNAKYELFSYLRVSDYDKAEPQVPDEVPDLNINTALVTERAISNSSHVKEQKLQLLNAEKSLAQAKADRGLQISLNGQIGFSKTASTFSSVYSKLRDNEIVGLTLSMPIFDWGVSKGKVRMAKAQLEVTKTQQRQSHEDFLEEIRRSVTRFNSQPSLCRDAMRAREIAQERYTITLKRFETGGVTVTELNTAQQELESSNAQYIAQLQVFWNDFYSLKKLTLYDWVNNHDIEADFDRLLK
ncbi:MAG: TolC family protein [Bacteroidaceae bacterium]|nr:TolC family protein [Bacteroidaceae bacterium]